MTRLTPGFISKPANINKLSGDEYKLNLNEHKALGYFAGVPSNIYGEIFKDDVKAFNNLRATGKTFYQATEMQFNIAVKGRITKIYGITKEEIDQTLQQIQNTNNMLPEQLQGCKSAKDLLNVLDFNFNTGYKRADLTDLMQQKKQDGNSYTFIEVFDFLTHAYRADNGYEGLFFCKFYTMDQFAEHKNDNMIFIPPENNNTSHKFAIKYLMLYEKKTKLDAEQEVTTKGVADIFKTAFSESCLAHGLEIEEINALTNQIVNNSNNWDEYFEERLLTYAQYKNRGLTVQDLYSIKFSPSTRLAIVRLVKNGLKPEEAVKKLKTIEEQNTANYNNNPEQVNYIIALALDLDLDLSIEEIIELYELAYWHGNSFELLVDILLQYKSDLKKEHLTDLTGLVPVFDFDKKAIAALVSSGMEPAQALKKLKEIRKPELRYALAQGLNETEINQLSQELINDDKQQNNLYPITKDLIDFYVKHKSDLAIKTLAAMINFPTIYKPAIDYLERSHNDKVAKLINTMRQAQLYGIAKGLTSEQVATFGEAIYHKKQVDYIVQKFTEFRIKGVISELIEVAIKNIGSTNSLYSFSEIRKLDLGQLLLLIFNLNFNTSEEDVGQAEERIDDIVKRLLNETVDFTNENIENGKIIQYINGYIKSAITNILSNPSIIDKNQCNEEEAKSELMKLSPLEIFLIANGFKPDQIEDLKNAIKNWKADEKIKTFDEIRSEAETIKIKVWNGFKSMSFPPDNQE